MTRRCSREREQRRESEKPEKGQRPRRLSYRVFLSVNGSFGSPEATCVPVAIRVTRRIPWTALVAPGLGGAEVRPGAGTIRRRPPADRRGSTLRSSRTPRRAIPPIPNTVATSTGRGVPPRHPIAFTLQTEFVGDEHAPIFLVLGPGASLTRTGANLSPAVRRCHLPKSFLKELSLEFHYDAGIQTLALSLLFGCSHFKYVAEAWLTETVGASKIRPLVRRADFRLTATCAKSEPLTTTKGRKLYEKGLNRFGDGWGAQQCWICL